MLWALLAASAAYWGLRLATKNASITIPTQTATLTAVDSLAVARALGATAAQAAPQASLASRFALLGVIAGTPRGNAALIAIDGKPAQTFRVGSTVDDGLVLSSASARQATLSAVPGGPALVTLDMPMLKN